MIDYANNEIVFEGCPGCAYAKGQFSLPCGMIYQDKDFTVSRRIGSYQYQVLLSFVP